VIARAPAARAKRTQISSCFLRSTVSYGPRAKTPVNRPKAAKVGLGGLHSMCNSDAKLTIFRINNLSAHRLSICTSCTLYFQQLTKMHYVCFSFLLCPNWNVRLWEKERTNTISLPADPWSLDDPKTDKPEQNLASFPQPKLRPVNRP